MNLKNRYPWILISTHTVPTRGFGGPSVSFRNVINMIALKGISYTLLTTDPKKSFEKKDGLNNEIFFKSFIFHKLGFSLTYIWRLIIELKSSEVVLINGLTTFINFSAILFSYLFKIKKVVLFPRGGLENGRTDNWSFIKKIIFYLQLKIIDKLALKNKLMVVYASKSELEKTSNKFSFNYCILPNINQNLFANNFKNNIERNIDILYVGRNSPEKGIDRLFQILEIVNKKPTISFNVIFDNIAADELKIIKKKYNNIKFMVGVDNNSVLKIMAKSKFLFFPSYVENYGNVLVEAVSKGVIPIVYHDTHWSILIDKFGLNVGFLNKLISDKIIWDKKLSELIRFYVYNNYVKNNNIDVITDWINNEI